ncbi:MAG: tRNA (N(6)-L-threonylcarbamoyladenosine(37)-C(2))-methylthiotransferase MtaB, partial [Clostridia bacterium]|nr:tRNA (N(6)-L-threonylcarbamoyladenosine(37)-C(2))-methylthiotransferase MtaB [Clostridia bacterium]
MKVKFYTLGCKVNQYETEAIAELFKDHGYVITDFSNKAHVYVINTCSVTAMSDRKSRQIIRRAK